jgi:alkanesulfonate monooxygenase SsuD/methylene tetrahydromethanopterin reductase-like flavin-dependent oxidoreductase (luciferase family)
VLTQVTRTTNRVALGVLDNDGSMGMAASLAPIAERAGYERYWFTEHQPQASPLLPTALLLGLTESLRVGTAGILLGYHNIYRVAQDFRFLNEVYPDRVDAGFCGGHVENAELGPLRGGKGRPSSQELEDRAETLVALLRDELPSDHRLAGVRQISRGPSATPWSLGTSERGAALAARLGVAYAHSLFHSTSCDRPEPIETYRDRFRGRAEDCRVALAISGVCAMTDEEAQSLRTFYRPIFATANVVGGVQRCADTLGDLFHRYRMDEIALIDVCRDPSAKLVSYELFAEAARMAFGEVVSPAGA